MTAPFGETLRELRKIVGKSQIEVANEISKMFKINMSQASLSTLEQRETLPRQELVEILAAYYNVSTNYFTEKKSQNEESSSKDLALDYIRALRNPKMPIPRKNAFARSDGRRSENDDISESLSNLVQNIDEEDIF